MSFWRAAGLTYIQYSNIAAKVVRKSLKESSRADAAKRDATSIRFTQWKEGKAIPNERVVEK